MLSLDKVRALLAGPRRRPSELDAKAQALLDAAATKRFAAGQTVVIPLEGLDPDERERYVRLAAAHRRAAPHRARRGRQGQRRRGGPRGARRSCAARSTPASSAPRAS